MEKKPKRTAKQIAALVAVGVLAVLYVSTLLLALFDTSSSGRWFGASLVETVAVPLLIWVFIWLYGKTTGKKTIADANLMQDPDQGEPVKTEEAEVEETKIEE